VKEESAQRPSISDRRSPSGGLKEVKRRKEKEKECPETTCTHEKWKGKFCWTAESVLITVARSWLKYVKADYGYHPFLRPCEKEYE
jgi:hypothetical protein